MADYLKASTQKILSEFMLRKDLTIFDYASQNRLSCYHVMDIEDLVFKPLKDYFDECGSDLHKKVMLKNHLFQIVRYLHTRAASFYLKSLEYDLLVEDREFCKNLTDKYHKILEELCKHVGNGRQTLKKSNLPFCDVYGE